MARARKYISHGGKTFIDDPSKLESIMELGAKGFITQIAQNTAKRLKYNTAELIYNGYEPKKYKRTKELLDSIQGPGINGGAPTKKTPPGMKVTNSRSEGIDVNHDVGYTRIGKVGMSG